MRSTEDEILKYIKDKFFQDTEPSEEALKGILELVEAMLLNNEAGGTYKDTVNVSITQLRKKTWQRHPAFDPKVLEGMLLVVEEYMVALAEANGLDVNEPIGEKEYPKVDADYALVLGRAFKRAVEKLDPR